MTGAADIGILRGLISLDHDRAAEGVEQLGAVNHALVLIQRLEEGPGKRRMFAPAIFDRLQTARGDHHPGLFARHLFEVFRCISVLDPHPGISDETARVTAVGHHHHMLGLNGPQGVGNGRI